MDQEDDARRCEIIREEIGWDSTLMLDANQVWDVQEAINNVKAPTDSNVRGISDQLFAVALNMFVMMTENLVPKPMGNDWYKKVKAKASELGDQTGRHCPGPHPQTWPRCTRRPQTPVLS